MCDDSRLILASPFASSQVDKLEEAESQRKTEEEVTEPQPMVFGRFTRGRHNLLTQCERFSLDTLPHSLVPCENACCVEILTSVYKLQDCLSLQTEISSHSELICLLCVVVFV